MKLKNNRYEVAIIEKGGEIASFTDIQTGIQYMWQGNKMFWAGKNPTLFPLIGNTHSKTYEIDGGTFGMNNHGLIRSAELTCIRDDGGEIVMALDSDESTLKQYPFPFHYEIAYKLRDNKLTVTYHITNTGKKDMPFSFGLHPGFNCPLCEGEKFEDYTMTFSNPEHSW